MSTAVRGRGRGFDRGARTNASGRGNTRGNSFRPNQGARANGTPETTAPTTNVWKRGHTSDRGHRGGPSRGGISTRGGNKERGGSFRGRGGSMRSASPTVPSSAVSNTTPFAQHQYAERLEYLREDRPRQREQLIKERRMNPDGPMLLSQAVKLVGICMEMCPEYERVRRIVEEDLKLPEYTAESLKLNDRKLRVPDESRMVKAYQRSAAGMETELVSDIRPPSVCLTTMNTMMDRLDSEDFEFLHLWLWDRTRAVRKDLRTQVVDTPEDLAIYLECFEQCARFLMLCLHHMSLSTSEDYSQQQDMEQLNQTCISLKERYADNRHQNIPSPNEAEFQAYRCIIASYTGDHRVDDEMENLPASLQRHPTFRTAMEINKAGKLILARSRRLSEAQQNWKAFWQLLRSPSVTYLMACAAEIGFNKLRHVVLDTIHRAYRQGAARQMASTQGDWTVSKLGEMLGFDTSDEVIDFCGQYGFGFLVNDNTGEEFMDLASVPYARGLEKPITQKPQTFSYGLVESKRKNRPLSAVIKEPEEPELDEDSLFVPDDSSSQTPTFAPKSSFGQPSLNAANTSTVFNPQANPFEPNKIPTQPTDSSSPFGKPQNTFGAAPNGAVNPFQGSSTPPLTSSASSFGKPSVFPGFSSQNGSFAGQTVQPGVFDPSKDTIKFARNGNSTSPFAGSNQGSTPFQSSGTSFPAKSNEQTTFPAASNALFSNTKAPSGGPYPSTPFSNPLSAAETQKPATTSAPGFSFLGQAPKAPPDSVGEHTNPFVARAPTAPPTASGPAPPKGILKNAPRKVAFDIGDQQGESQEEKDRRARAEQLEQEIKARKVNEEQLRAAEERERLRKVEKERLAREQKERREREERLAREERERREREEQERREREERERIAQEARRIEEATQALTNNIFLSPLGGLLSQFIDMQVQKMVPEVKEELWWEKAEKIANERYEQKQQQLIRACLARWCAKVEKRKRAEKARARRRWLRENAETLRALEAEGVSNGVDHAIQQKKGKEKAKPTNQSQVNGASKKATKEPRSTLNAQFRKPTAPASASRTGSRAQQQTNGAPASRTTSNPKPAQEPSPVPSSSAPIPYKNDRMRIDRTETDWFKLKAMGIDPRQHRKRSFEEHSDSGEADDVRKRARTSVSSTPPPSARPSPQPQKPQATGSILDRFKAFKESFSRAGSSPRPSSRSVHGSPDSSNGIISKARALLSTNNTTTRASPPAVQHEFSRSVPNLAQLGPTSSRHNFGQSYGTQASQDKKPAYWGRKSRFVPQHLYGKGPEAVTDYLRQSRGSNGSSVVSASMSPPVRFANSQALEISSPVPTQISYIPESQSQSQPRSRQDFDFDDLMSGANPDADMDVEDLSGSEESDGVYERRGRQNEVDDMLDEDEYDEEEEEEAEADGYDEDEDEEEQYECQSDGDEGGYRLTYEEQNAQIMPGGTQDDAIELSD